MKIKGSLIVMSGLLISVALCSLSLPQQDQKEERAKNLKVLPKDISHEDLENVMRGFKNALGVKCGFCHDPRKDDPKKLDFAGDENKHKGIARDMMRMTARINKKYFKENGNETLKVTCFTCHHGNEEPKSQPESTGTEKK